MGELSGDCLIVERDGAINDTRDDYAEGISVGLREASQCSVGAGEIVSLKRQSVLVDSPCVVRLPSVAEQA